MDRQAKILKAAARDYRNQAKAAQQGGNVKRATEFERTAEAYDEQVEHRGSRGTR